MPPRKRDPTLWQAYQQRSEDSNTSYVLDAHEDQTTSQIIASLRELPTISLDIKISKIGDYLPSNLPPNNIILFANILRALLPIPLPEFIYRVTGELNISPIQLTPNSLRNLLAVRVLFKEVEVELTMRHICQLFQLKGAPSGQRGLFTSLG